MKNIVMNFVILVSFVATSSFAMDMPETFSSFLSEKGIWFGEANYFGRCETKSFPYATRIDDNGASLKSLRRSDADPYQNYILTQEGLSFELRLRPSADAITGVLNEFSEVDENTWKFSGTVRTMNVDFVLAKDGQKLNLETRFNGKKHASIALEFRNTSL